MSHFAVLVVGENPEQQLAPFQENNMEDCPQEYLSFYDVEDEYLEQYENEDVHKNQFSSFEDFMKEYAGYSERDVKTGRFGYWENPNKKWDWYVLGGRWSGFFTLKSGGVANQACKKDIDFDAIVSKAVKRAEKDWDEAQNDVKEDEAIRFFRYGIKKGSTREQHIEEARKNAYTTFAVLKDGIWYERGEMGWWGCVSNEKKGCNWRDEYMALFDEIEDDELLSIYDCHI